MTTIPATFDGSTNVYTNNQSKPLTKNITSISKPDTTTVKNPNLLFRDSNSSVDPSKFIDVNSSGLKPGDGSTLIDTTNNKPAVKYNDEINTSFIPVENRVSNEPIVQSTTNTVADMPRTIGSTVYPKPIKNVIGNSQSSTSLPVDNNFIKVDREDGPGFNSSSNASEIVNKILSTHRNKPIIDNIVTNPFTVGNSTHIKPNTTGDVTYSYGNDGKAQAIFDKFKNATTTQPRNGFNPNRNNKVLGLSSYLSDEGKPVVEDVKSKALDSIEGQLPKNNKENTFIKDLYGNNIDTTSVVPIEKTKELVRKFPKVLAFRNNNPFNIRPSKNSKWVGATGSSEGYVQFADMEHGARAGFKDIRTKINNGIDTIEKVISKFAPSSENNTSKYIANVSKWSGIDKNTKLTEKDLPKILRAMARQEMGTKAYNSLPPKLFDIGYKMSLK